MKLKQTILLFLFLFTNLTLSSQGRIANLIDNENHFMYKDSKGFVWIASLNGVNRYDGTNVVRYFPDNTNPKALQEGLIQSSFFEDDLQNLWFSTHKHLYCYNRKNDNFEHFTMSTPNAVDYRFIGLFNQKEVWMQVGDELYSFNIKTKTSQFFYKGFRGIRYAFNFDEHNQVKHLFGTREDYGNGLLKLTFNEDNSIDCDTLFKEEITYQIINHNNHYWITTPRRLIKMNYNSVHENVKTPFKVHNISPMLTENKILISDGNMLYAMNTSNYAITQVNKNTDRPISRSYSIAKNEVYGYTDNYGLFPLDLESSTLWNLIPDIENSISSLISFKRKDQEYIIASTDKGEFFDYDLNKRTIYKKIFAPNAKTIVDGKANIFVCLSNEILKYNHYSHSFTKYIDRLPARILGVINFNNTTGILGTGGVSWYTEKGEFINSYLKEDLINTGTFYQDYLILETSSGIRVHKILGTELIKEKIIKLEHAISQFLVVDSLILLATNSGIKTLDIEAGRINNYLLDNIYIQSLCKANNGDLWAASLTGLYKIDGDGRVFYFDKSTGLPNENFTKNNASISRDGTLWWGTTDGVLYFHPDSIINEVYNPPIVLNSLKIHGHEWANDTTNIEEIENISLNYNENTLRFEFTAIDYNKNNRPQYQVFMDGNDADTTDLGNQNYISYPNLSPGDYTFTYSACTLTGLCPPVFKEFLITIRPPYWKTNWFRGLMALTLILVITAFINMYIQNRLKEQRFAYEKQKLHLKNQLQLQEERNRIADELHDELGGKLSSIKFAGKKAQRAKSLSEVKAISERVSEISSELIDSMRSIIWAMDTDNDILSSLLANFRQYASRLAEDNDLSIKFDFPSLEIDPEVKGQIRHHLYLAFKEILNNILKHSSADRLVIKVAYSKNSLVVSIDENGKGFDPVTKIGTGKGLKTIKKRVELMKGELAYTNTNTMRTTIKVSLA